MGVAGTKTELFEFFLEKKSFWLEQNRCFFAFFFEKFSSKNFNVFGDFFPKNNAFNDKWLLKSGTLPDPEPGPNPESGPEFLEVTHHIRTGVRTGHFPVPDRTGFYNNFQFMITFTVTFLGH